VVEHSSARSGLYVTFVNSHLSVDEVAYIVNDCGASTFVAAEAFAVTARAVVTQRETLQNRIALGAIDGFDDCDDVIAAASQQCGPIDFKCTRLIVAEHRDTITGTNSSLVELIGQPSRSVLQAARRACAANERSCRCIREHTHWRRQSSLR
jgi:hypothetical protein